MRTHSILFFLSPLLILSLTRPTVAKRGGSGSGSGDSNSDSSSSSSSSDSSYEKDKCRGAIRAQQEHTYTHPGSYYNGSLTVTHNIQDDRDDVSDTGVCLTSNLGTKTYTFADAVLHIGPPLDSNNTNNYAVVHWALRAFIPYENGRYSYSTLWGAGPKREIFRLQSAAYDYDVSNFSKTDVPVQCWDTGVTRSGGGGGYNISSQYRKMTRLRQNAGGGLFGGYGKEADSASNWITLVDICTSGFDKEGTWDGDDSTVVNITEWAGQDAGMAFLQPGRADAAAPVALISGVGTNETQFSLTNGSLERAFFGATTYSDNCQLGGAETSPYYFWERYRSRRGTGPRAILWQFDLNLTARFDLRFDGKLQKERSWGFVDESGDIPKWDLGKKPKIAPGSGSVKLEAGWGLVYGVVFWTVVVWWLTALL